MTLVNPLLLLIIDSVAITASLYTSTTLLDQSTMNLLPILGAIAAFTGVGRLVGLYRISISHMGIAGAKKVAPPTMALALVLYLSGMSEPASFFSSLLVFVVTIGYRVFARETSYIKRQSSMEKTLVYGAGSAGVQFVTASMQGSTHNVVGLVDRDPNMCGKIIHGCRVYSYLQVPALVTKKNVSLIVLAMPSASPKERKAIVDSLSQLQVRVVTVPPVEDLLRGIQSITATEAISINDLLGRDTVPPSETFMEAKIAGKTCLVTGAGGSIGAELCRQICRNNPKKLILIDFSEPSLFTIQQELLQSNTTNFICYLGSVTDEDFLQQIFLRHEVDTVFHAAAYKHVPMVELNPLAGLMNNVKGTEVLLDCAVPSGCESFTLISTDKAVRPTNVMGATKRLAEMLCQAKAKDLKGKSRTVISMVRFGNVLGSSGSVIPTFQKQILEGGPVTLTHPEITRYFMTIPEAAQLVIQASGMAESGDLFLLDMGSPVKIYDLAERLILLSGKVIRRNGEENTLNSVEVKITGLRDGEKLYEELLVDARAQPTQHPKIVRAREGFLAGDDLSAGIQKLINYLEHADTEGFKLQLAKMVSGYTPHNMKKSAISEASDHHSGA